MGNASQLLVRCFAWLCPLESWSWKHSFTRQNFKEVDRMKARFLIGRILFGGFFLYNGINHSSQRDGILYRFEGRARC